jgi:hypothetical protein
VIIYNRSKNQTIAKIKHFLLLMKKIAMCIMLINQKIYKRVLNLAGEIGLYI